MQGMLLGLKLPIYSLAVGGGSTGSVEYEQECRLAFFNQDIFELTEQNRDFRREILTGQHSQLVLMSIEPGDDIGEETHDVDQILVVVSGEGEAVLDGQRSQISAQRAIVVPAGTGTTSSTRGCVR